jgi:hypothetical protein
MKRLSKARIAPGTALGVIALVVALGGGALAASGGNGTITACVQKQSALLYQAKKCAKHDRKLSWSTRGPVGAVGAVGATGAQGPQGNPGSARGWAFIDSDGTVKNRGGAVSISIHKVKTGEYCLLFAPKLDSLTFQPIVATLQGADFTAGLISANTSVGSDCNPDGGAGVFTMNPAGVATDHQFVVAIM